MKNDKICADLYASCFGLFTETASLCMSDGGRPFCDKGMETIAFNLKNLLLSPVDEAVFFSEYLRFIKMSADYLNEKGYLNYFTASASSVYGDGIFGRFYTAYFANLMLFSFTKWNFCDMLVPDEKVILGAGGRSYRAETGHVLKKDELHKICATFKSLTDLPGIDYGKMFSALKSAVNKDNPVFADLNNRGILSAIITAR